MKSCGFITETWGGGICGGSLSHDGNRGACRENNEDKEAEDDGKGEDPVALDERTIDPERR